MKDKVLIAFIVFSIIAFTHTAIAYDPDSQWFQDTEPMSFLDHKMEHFREVWTRTMDKLDTTGYPKHVQNTVKIHPRFQSATNWQGNISVSFAIENEAFFELNKNDRKNILVYLTNVAIHYLELQTLETFRSYYQDDFENNKISPLGIDKAIKTAWQKALKKLNVYIYVGTYLGGRRMPHGPPCETGQACFKDGQFVYSVPHYLNNNGFEFDYNAEDSVVIEKPEIDDMGRITTTGYK